MDPSNVLICSWHFEPKDIKNIAGKVFLLPKAIPTLNFARKNVYDNNVIVLEHDINNNPNTSKALTSIFTEHENTTSKTLMLISKRNQHSLMNNKDQSSEIDHLPFDRETNLSLAIVDAEMFDITTINMEDNETTSFLSVNESNGGPNVFKDMEITSVNTTAEIAPDTLSAYANPNNDFSTPPTKPKLQKKKLKIRYAGDIDPRANYSPKTANLALKVCHKALLSTRKKIGPLRSKLRRRDNRINSMQKLITKLKTKFGLSEHCKNEMEMNFSDEILQQLKNGKMQKEYSSDVKAFACTLNFYSSPAYEYVRHTFGKHLPAESTIKNWYRNVEASPGTLQIALDLLKRKVESDQNKQKKVYVSLMLDEMSIRQQQFWDDSKKEWHGLVDFGSELIKGDSDVVASKALVYLVNSTNEHWKLPVAYYFTHSMTGSELASLTRHVIEQLHETGIIVTSLTFDGPRVNISMAQELGGQLWHYLRLKTSFEHPITKQAIFLFLDIPHMIKLVRNVLGSKEILYDGEKKPIKWEYIVELEKLQTKEGLMAGTKLRKRHIQFGSEKMKVKLATQTLSDGVADALTYCCKNLKLKQFRGSEATVKFIRLFNRLFDVLNSRNMTSSGFKKGLCKENADSYFEFFEEAKTYIKQLTLDKKQLVVDSDSRTGFVGFLTGMESTQKMYSMYVAPKDAAFKFLLMHKFNQDPLESTFSVIRSKRGSDDSPNTDHFKGIMKRLLYQNDLKCYSKGTNSLVDDAPFFNTSHKYIRIGSRNKNIIKINENIMDNLQNNIEYDDDFDEEFLGTELTRYVADVVVYISSFVERRLKKQIKCAICLECLNGDAVIGGLITTKAREGLLYPQKNIVEVCRIVEKGIRCFNIKEKHFYSKLKLWCFRQINGSFIFSNMNGHILDQAIIDNHKYLLISSTIDIFLKIRMHHLGHVKTEEMVKLRIRNKTKKIVHFKGQ